MSERAPYSRVYWSVMDDAKFDGVREDVRLFGSWSLLLVLADMAHPVPAYVPRTVPQSAISRLSSCGLIDLLDGHRYRIHGLEAERTRRRSAATRRDPIGTQTGPNRDPDGQQAKQSKAETEQRLDEAGTRDPAEIYWQLTGRYPTAKLLSWIDESTERYGSETVIRGLVTAHRGDPSGSTLMGRAQDLWRREARELDLQERAAERDRVREKRALPHVLEPWEEAYRAELHRQYAEDAA